MPINITNTDPCCSITQDISPIGQGVAFILPFDTYTYQVTFTAVLKINTENVPLNPPNTLGSIYYLSGSANSTTIPPAEPAIAQLIVYQLNSSGVIIDENPAATQTFTWETMCVNPSSINTPPNNFNVYQEPNIPGPGGAYYQSCASNTNPAYNITPILDSCGQPLARRLVSVVVTAGFSFSQASMTITRII
jgi:hypothetical protein